MPNCVVCDGRGKVNVGLLSAGNICRTCQGQGKTDHVLKPCKLCDARGAVDTLFGLSARECPACNGCRYVSHRQVPCIRCHGKGAVPRMFGLSHNVCPTCAGTAYVHAKQIMCKLCEGRCYVRSWLTSRQCPACEGCGHVLQKQYACRRCDTRGTVGSQACPLCHGRCWLYYDQQPCNVCHGHGSLSGWFKSSPCTQCAEAGYLPVQQMVVTATSDDDTMTSCSERTDSPVRPRSWDKRTQARLEHAVSDSESGATSTSFSRTCRVWAFVVILAFFSISAFVVSYHQNRDIILAT